MLSAGRVALSTGTLYGAIKRLLEQGWIGRTEDPLPDKTARKGQAYALTQTGRRVLEAKIRRLQAMVRAAGLRPVEEGAMKPSLPGVGACAWLLHLYPECFRTQLGEEMQDVFSSALAVAALWLRELRDLPLGLVRER